MREYALVILGVLFLVGPRPAIAAEAIRIELNYEDGIKKISGVGKDAEEILSGLLSRYDGTIVRAADDLRNSKRRISPPSAKTLAEVSSVLSLLVSDPRNAVPKDSGFRGNHLVAAAIRSFGLLQGIIEADRKALRGNLASKDTLVQRAAIATLGEISDAESLPELTRIFEKTEDPDVRAIAAIALSTYDERNPIPMALKTKVLPYRLLGFAGPTGDVEIEFDREASLTQFLDLSPEARAEVVRELDRIARGFPANIRMSMALGDLFGQRRLRLEDYPPLLDLSHPVPAIRRFALETLAERSKDSAPEALRTRYLEILKKADADNDETRIAAAFLARLGDRRAIAPITALWRKSDSFWGRDYLRALSRYGADAAFLVPELEKEAEEHLWPLSRIGTDRAWRAVIQALKTASPLSVGDKLRGLSEELDASPESRARIPALFKDKELPEAFRRHLADVLLDRNVPLGKDVVDFIAKEIGSPPLTFGSDEYAYRLMRLDSKFDANRKDWFVFWESRLKATLKDGRSADLKVIANALARFGADCAKLIPSLPPLVKQQYRAQPLLPLFAAANSETGIPALMDVLLEEREKGWSKNDARNFFERAVAETLAGLPGVEKALPKLGAALQNKKISELSRGHIGEVIARRGSESDFELLWKAQDEAHGTPLGDALMRSLGRHAASRLPEVAEKIAEALKSGKASRYEDGTKMMERIGALLSEKEEDELVRLLKLKIGGETATRNPCDSLCAIVEKTDAWLKKESLDRPEFWAEGHPTYSWRFATRALAAAFLVKAEPFCDPARPRTRAIVSQWSRGTKALEKEKTPAPPEKELTRVLKEAGVELDPATLGKLEKFQANTRGGLAKDAAVVYGKQFYALLLKEILAASLVEGTEAEAARKALAETERSLGFDLTTFDQTRSGVGGSLMNTYALTSSIVQHSSPPDRALGRLRSILETYGGDPTLVPYGPDPLYKDEKNKEARRGGTNPREAASRAVTFNLALYSNASEKDRPKRREDLVAALRNFARHGFVASLHVGRDKTHYFDFDDGFGDSRTDAIAPYYYYSNVPYATAAIALLRNDPGSDARELDRLQDRIHGTLDRMIRKDELFTPQGKVHYPSSEVYVNPLGGFALLPLVRECNGKKVPPSSGILPRFTARKTPEPSRGPGARDH